MAADADTNPASMASLSSAELAERLEKSESGRKKLRKAIAILQEKLDAMDKVLKVNDKLRQECEQERKRAETEKKKAEEEKRLKSLLEKDSNTFKDQLTKVLQRLGAVESKQKADKKEMERLRNEVKLSVEGMQVASQTVNVIQSSLQTLETSLLDKVNAAFEEAHAATEAVKHLEGSLQSLEHTIVKQGSAPGIEPGLRLTGRVMEKLVDEISRLFSKERQSHCKIERRLSMLKSAFKVGKRSHALSSAENNVDLEGLVSSKKQNDKPSKKRKSRGEGDVIEQKVRKVEKPFDMAAVHSAADSLAKLGHNQADKDQSMSSPYLVEQQRASDDERGSLRIDPPSYNTESNDYNEAAVVDHRGSSNNNTHLQVSPREATANKCIENLGDTMVKIVAGGFHENALVQNDVSSELQSEDDGRLSQRGRNKLSVGVEENPGGAFSTCKNTANMSSDGVDLGDINKAADSDLDVDEGDDSENWWLSNDRVLLSPSLPDIPSPLHHSPAPPMEPPPLRSFFGSTTDSNVSCEVLVNDASVVCEAAKLHGDVIKHNPELAKACNDRLDVNTMRCNTIINNSNFQLGSFSSLEQQQSANPTDFILNSPIGLEGNAVVQRVQCNQDAGVSSHETGIDALGCLAHDIDGASHEAHPDSNPVSMVNNISIALHETSPGLDHVCVTMPGHGSSVALDNQVVTQFEAFMPDVVGDVTISEISNFLEVLPPMSDALPSEFGAWDPALSTTREPVSGTCPSDKVCTSSQPRATCEGQLSKNIDNDKESMHRLSFSVLEDSNPQGTRPLTNKPSSPFKASSLCEVFLLQAFELEEVDAKVNLTAACILVNDLESHLAHANTEKGEVQLQEEELYKTITDLPLVYVACCIISHAVDSVRSEKGVAELGSATRSMDALLQTYVAFIRSMFKEKANILLNTILAQLSRFLIQGEAMLLMLDGLISPCDDALSVARVIHDKKQCSYQYFEATLEDIYAGGKVLAALCRVLACVTHLQNIVCEVLGWCDKDIMWLLTVFSSFSSICGHTAFMVETDDLLGHAICAIIIELVASVEQELGKIAESEITQATPSPTNKRSIDLVSWTALKEALKVNGNFSVKQVFLSVMAYLQYTLTCTQDTLLSSSLRTDLLTAKECNLYDKAKNECSEISYRRVKEDSYPHQEVETVSKAMPKSLSKGQVASAVENMGPQKWRRKYVQAVGALQLIAQFMGWEWTYNHLIIRCLWKTVTSCSVQLHAAGISHVLSLLARTAAKAGGMDLPGLADLKQQIIDLVQSTPILIGKAESILLFSLR